MESRFCETNSLAHVSRKCSVSRISYFCSTFCRHFSIVLVISISKSLYLQYLSVLFNTSPRIFLLVLFWTHDCTEVGKVIRIHYLHVDTCCTNNIREKTNSLATLLTASGYTKFHSTVWAWPAIARISRCGTWTREVAKIAQKSPSSIILGWRPLLLKFYFVPLCQLSVWNGLGRQNSLPQSGRVRNPRNIIETSAGWVCWIFFHNFSP